MFALILAAVLVAGCGGNEASQPGPTTAPAKPTEAPAALTAAPTSPPPTAAPTAVQSTETSPERRDSMKIRLRAEDTEITATLVDSETTRDFIFLLPLTLTLEDYARTEKTSNLSSSTFGRGT